MNNPHNLPPHLIGMTQERWDALSPAERNKMRDNSHLHPALIGFEGKRVRVHPKRECGRSTFRVGISSGWCPIHLAMRSGSYGSSDTIRADETITHVELVR